MDDYPCSPLYDDDDFGPCSLNIDVFHVYDRDYDILSSGYNAHPCYPVAF
jgi:hypothetical protein